MKTKNQMIRELLSHCIFLEDASIEQIQSEIEGSGFTIIKPKDEARSYPFFLRNGNLIFEFESVHGRGKMFKIENNIKKLTEWLGECYSDASKADADRFIKDARRFSKLLNKAADNVAKASNQADK